VKNVVFRDVAPFRSCVNRPFGGTWVQTISKRRHIPEDVILQEKVLFCVVSSDWYLSSTDTGTAYVQQDSRQVTNSNRRKQTQ
jgi:hypothetical protein